MRIDIDIDEHLDGASDVWILKEVEKRFKSKKEFKDKILELAVNETIKDEKEEKKNKKNFDYLYSIKFKEGKPILVPIT